MRLHFLKVGTLILQGSSFFKGRLIPYIGMTSLSTMLRCQFFLHVNCIDRSLRLNLIG
jgi:hypothetical protein